MPEVGIGFLGVSVSSSAIRSDASRKADTQGIIDPCIILAGRKVSNGSALGGAKACDTEQKTATRAAKVATGRRMMNLNIWLKKAKLGSNGGTLVSS